MEKEEYVIAKNISPPLRYDDIECEPLYQKCQISCYDGPKVFTS